MNRTPTARLRPLALLALPLLGIGCGESVSSTTTSVLPTPGGVLAPKAPEEQSPPAGGLKAQAPAPAPGRAEKDGASLVGQAASALVLVGLSPAPPDEVALIPVKYDEFRSRIASNGAKGAKFTLVDAWATTCGPCKENFPHLVEMHRKYAKLGLAVVSLTLDDPTDAK